MTLGEKLDGHDDKKIEIINIDTKNHEKDQGLSHQLDGHADHQHELLGHDEHKKEIIKIPQIHVQKQPILLPSHHDSHHDHGHDHEHHHCPKNEMWSKCGGHCEPSCKNPHPQCSKVSILRK